MKNRVLPILTCFAVWMTCWFYGNTVFAQGDGTASNPYQISTAEQLVSFAECIGSGNPFYYADGTCLLNAPTEGNYSTIPARGEGTYFRLMNDITLNNGNLAACDGEIDPAWTVWPETGVFKGHFLGESHMVSGMYIERPEGSVGVGFFSKVEGNALIERLGIVNS